METLHDKMVAAFRSDDPEGRLVRLILHFKASGGTQDEAEEAVVKAFEELGVSSRDDPRGNAYDNVLDAIVGNCCLTNHLFADDFQEWHYYRPLPPAT